MTTPANDETKKEEKKGSVAGTQSTKDADSGAPKKRKRKPRTRVSPMTTPMKKKSNDDEHHPEGHKTAPLGHAKKEAKPKKTEKKSANKQQTGEEQKKPNLDIKSETHMLPGIDNINEYIARKKAISLPHQDKKEVAVSFITPEGIDLLALPDLYAIVPHSKGDHKLVYMKANAPVGLIDDPRKRIPGNMYVKNGRDIYMVTLTMKEHPTLKNGHGDAQDVWIIDTPDQLTEQINAIKQGMGGGENFGDVILISSLQKTGISETTIPEEDNTTNEPQHISEEKPDEEAHEITEEKDEEVSQQINTDTPATVLPELDIEEKNIDTNMTQTDMDAVDLTLPTDEEFPEIDTEQAIPEIDFVAQETPIEQPEEITLDMEIPSAEEVIEDQAPSASIHHEEHDVHSVSDKQPEEITLDMPASFLGEAGDQSATLHFTTPELTSTHGTLETPHEEAGSLFVTPQDSTVSLPLEEKHAEGGMFRDPVISNQPSELTLDPHAEGVGPQIKEDLPPSPTDPFFSSHQADLIPGSTSTSETSESLSVTTPSDPVEQATGAGNSFDLDDLRIEESSGHDNQSIDLDSASVTGTGVAMSDSDISNKGNAQRHLLPQKSKFPFTIIIRLVLFLLIAGALILVRKVMFPAIKGAKPVDNSEVSTGQLIDDNEQMSGDVLPIDTPPSTSGTTIPTDDAEINTPPTDDTEINTPPENTDDTPNASLTLNELTEKLKLQQTEARKVLNIAKLLENKQAIKFSLAAMLKAGNVLERIETETTITAQDVLQESEKIDRYLMDANKLIE